MKKIIFLTIFIPLLSFMPPGRKQITVQGCKTSPKIDAILDDIAWKDAVAIDDFIQHSPINGGEPSEKTHVQITYDNDALFVSAILYDTYPDSILTEYGPRDAGDQLNADLFSIELNPYNDGRSSFEFMTSASGIQMDSRNTIEAMNKSWNAV